MKPKHIGGISFGSFFKRQLRWMTAGLIACVPVFAGTLAAEVPAKVRFVEDVAPILRENCRECHGPDKEKAGLRLDRRSSAMKGMARRVIPGGSANSKVYLRLVRDQFGDQMPPKGALPAEQIAIIQKWIDQGAEWPDELANEAELPPVDPRALALIEALRNGDHTAVLKAAKADPAVLNARGPSGSSPFMYAALYADTGTLAKLIKLGADVNRANDDKATALIWAARDLVKTRLLVAHGADVNARSDDLRTPLMIAARRPGGAPIVRLLLEKGANPNPNKKPVAESSPLMEALTAGDVEIVQLLLEHGADAKATADQGLLLAVTSKSMECLELIAPQITDKAVNTAALLETAMLGNLRATQLMLDHGGDANGVDATGRTPLMYAAISDVLPLEVVKLLVQHGADVNAKSLHAKSGDTGLTVLDIAKLNGRTPIVAYLEKAGAKVGVATAVAWHPRKDNSIRGAVHASLPLVQRADSFFTKNAGCSSCHNNSMEAMTVGLARKHGFVVDQGTTAAQVKFNVEELAAEREKLHQGYAVTAVGDMFTDFVLGYQLVGLAAEGCPADINTDAAALLILSRQKGNGEWPYPHADSRPPICSAYIGQTALAMRGLQLYAPKTHRVAADKAVRRAASWLAQAQSFNNEDRAWRLTGLAWADSDRAAIRKARQELLAAQKPDGGWSDLPTMASAPYATGRSLVALRLGGLPASDPAFQRGVNFLLAAQQEDGSWFTKTRALGSQPYFEGSFPHGYDQWTSAAATSWAAMALTLALPEGPVVTASRNP